MRKSYQNWLIAGLALALIGQAFMQAQSAALAQDKAAAPTVSPTPQPHADHLMPKENTADNTASLFARGLNESMRVMHEEMMKPKFTGNNDRDFLATMLPHHQGAIDMAKLVLLYGKDERTRRLAQGIIIEQQSEIDAMSRRLNEIDSKGKKQ